MKQLEDNIVRVFAAAKKRVPDLTALTFTSSSAGFLFRGLAHFVNGGCRTFWCIEDLENILSRFEAEHKKMDLLYGKDNNKI